MMIKLSIITGTLNRIEHVKKVIENTVDDCDELELILIDGGSTDGTIEYVKSLDNERINFIEIGERSSYPSFMNIGLKLAKSEWIVQWNDDVLLVNDWEDVIKLIDEDKFDVYIFDWTRGRIYDFQKNVTMDPSIFGSYWIFFTDCLNFGLYRKKIFREIGMYDNKFNYYECDHDMTMRCIYFGYKVTNCHDIKVFEILTDKRSINYDNDKHLYVKNLIDYQKKKIPDNIEKL